MPHGWIDRSVTLPRLTKLQLYWGPALLLPVGLGFWAAETYGGGVVGALPEGPLGVALALAAFVLAVLLHELTHALTWQILARPERGAIRLGIDRATLTPYAHVKVPIRARAYRWGVVMPTLLIGLLPLMLGLAYGLGWLIALASVMIVAGFGDLLVLWLIRDVPGTRRVLDHPSAAGCLVEP